MPNADSPRCLEVWLVRHGETASNVSRTIQGHTDTPLNDNGVRQAEMLAAWLKARSPRGFQHVVSSPLSRARRTAEAIATALQLPILEEPRFMERSFGDWEGRSAEDVYAAQDQSQGDAFDFHPPNGESTHDMAARVWAAFDAWADDPRTGERGLVVTHGGPIGALVCRALGLAYCAQSIRAFRRDNTAVTILRRRKSEPGTFVVDTLNARFHLDDG